MSTTVLAPSGLEISSNDSSSEEMLKSLTPPSGDKSPRVLVDKGKTVKPIPDKDAAEGDDTSRAASVLGKKGGEAAAKARALAEKAKGKDAAKDATETATGDEKGKAETKGDEEAETDAAAKEAADKKKGNPRHDPQARVQEATREAAEAKREAAEARRQLQAERTERERIAREADDLRAGRQPAAREDRQAREQNDGRPQPPAKPKPDDFNTYEEYLDARDDHNHRTREHEQKRQEGAHRVAQGITNAVHAFNKRISDAGEADPSLVETAKDFAAGLRPSFALAHGERVGPEHVIADHIIISEHAPALLRHFAEDGGVDGPEFQRIAALGGPTEIRLGLAKLEGRLEAATADTSTSREVSRAGSPVRSVAGSPHAAEPDVHGDIPFDVFMARKAKK